MHRQDRNVIRMTKGQQTVTSQSLVDIDTLYDVTAQQACDMYTGLID